MRSRSRGLVAEGLSNQAVAARLHLSARSVETHLSSIYRKASLPSRSALAGLMARSGMQAGAGLQPRAAPAAARPTS